MYSSRFSIVVFVLACIQAYVCFRVYFDQRKTLTISCAQNGKVTVYSKSTCQYCRKALDLLEQKYKLTTTIVDVADENRCLLCDISLN